MREILFRGKTKIDKKWKYGFYHKYRSTGASIPMNVDYYIDDENNSNIHYWVDEETIGQYTGLKDKNGKKIFEHDIVKLSYIDENDNELTGTWFAIVEFGNPNGEYDWGFQLKPISKCKWNSSILLWVDMEETGAFCEVIGNIYDNQELLKQ